ncbi:MAG: C25 family cysteine peptidase [bacterium]|nr:C25 family cysteine peptidase [bacterium]
MFSSRKKGLIVWFVFITISVGLIALANTNNKRVETIDFAQKIILTSSVNQQLTQIPSTSKPISEKANVRILQQSERSLRLQFHYPSVQIDTFSGSPFLRINGLENERIEEGYLLPIDLQRFVWYHDDIYYRVVSIETEQLEVPRLTYIPSVFGDSIIETNPISSTGFIPTPFIQTHLIGKYRGIPIASIVVHPIRYNVQENKIQQIKELVVEIYSKSQSVALSGRMASPSERIELEQLVGPLSATIPHHLVTGLSSTPAIHTIDDNGYAVRFDVKEFGVYRVTGQDLINLGVPISNIQPSTLILRSEGEYIPILFEGDEDGRFDPWDAFEFFGRPPLPEDTIQAPDLSGNSYTIEKAYLLTWNTRNGQRIPQVSGEIRITNPLDTNLVIVSSGPLRIHYEQSPFFGGLAEVERPIADRYFWDAGIYNFEIRDYNFYLPYPDTSSFTPVRVKVALHGLTGGLTRHHAFVILNNATDYSLDIGRTPQGAFDWIGQTARIGESTASSQMFNRNFHHGINVLSVFCPGDAPGATPTNRIALNWFQIEYLRFPIADNDEIRIGTPLTQNIIHRYFDFVLENFTSPDIHVYRWGSAKVINGTVERYLSRDNQIRYKIHFQDNPSQPTEYYAVTSSRKKSFLSDQMALIPPDTILSPPNGGAEYLVIGTTDLLATPQLEQLLALRSQQMNGVLKVNIEAILRRFTQGMFHPKGVLEFLRYAVRNWQIPPRYILLLGDGLQRQHRSPRKNGALIPHPMVPVSQIGVVGSDTWYSILDDENDLPDIHISRVPARTQEEAGFYFNKVLELENNPTPDRWQNYITFVTGSGGQNLYTIYNRINRDRLSPYYDFWEMQVENPSLPYYGGTSLLQNLFEKGSALVIYNGHGAGEIWSDGGLFRTRDIANMRNAGKYPLICNFSCFIVAFNGDVQRSSMGEDFVLHPNKGAVGVFGTAGLGYREQMILFQQFMFEQIRRYPNISYGELMTLTKSIYLSRYGNRAMFGPVGNTFYATSLLGDPAFRFKAFENIQQNSSQLFVQVGDSIDIQASLPFNSGNVSFIWYNQNHFSIDNPVWEPIVSIRPIVSNSFSTRIRVPSGISTNGLTLRGFYQSNHQTAVRGATSFYIQSAASSGFIDSVTTDPNPLLSDTTFKFYVKLIDSDGIRTLQGIIRKFFLDDSILSIDTIQLSRSFIRGPFWYESSLQPALLPSMRLRTNWRWIDSLGNVRQPNQDYDFYAYPGRPNLVVPNQVHWRATDSLFVRFTVTNNSPLQVPPTLLRVAIIKQISDTITVEFLSVPSIPPYTAQSVYYPFQYPPGQYKFSYYADYENVVNEVSENDNYNLATSNNVYWWITATEGDRGFSYNPTSRVSVSIPPNSIQKPSTVLSVTYSDTLHSRLQTLNKFAIFGRNPSNVFNGGGIVFLQIDTTAYLNRVIIHMQADTILGNRTKIHSRHFTNLWKMLNSTVDNQGIHLYDGPPYQQFSLMDNQDRTAPKFDFTVEGQIFSDGGYIRSGARLSASVYDNGGLDLSQQGSVYVVVDGDTLPSNELLLPISNQVSQNSSIVVTKRFSTGRHWAKLIVTDLASNTATDSINFLVANQFRLEWFGNFPNPFQKTTTFFYSLTDQTTEPVEIKIYTVSGKKIRTLRETDPQVINYREITWDGRDENGEVVANGVYFYRLTAKSNNQVIEKKGKLAKLR